MSKSYREITRSISTQTRKLRAAMPETMAGWTTLAQAALKGGALDAKTKELICLALGVAEHCDGCIGYHVAALVKLGATRAEFEETLGVAVYMGGGPSLMYAADAVTAWEEYSAPAEPAPAAK